MILNLAVWFAVHVIFSQTRNIVLGPLNFDAPVFSSINVWAAALSLAAVIAMFILKIRMIPVLAVCAATGIALYLAGLI